MEGAAITDTYTWARCVYWPVGAVVVCKEARRTFAAQPSRVALLALKWIALFRIAGVGREGAVCTFDQYLWSLSGG